MGHFPSSFPTPPSPHTELIPTPPTPTSPLPSSPSSPHHLPHPHPSFSHHTPAPAFSAAYCLGSELGRGGFGFVHSATRISDGCEVACKFIVKTKVPPEGWAVDKELGRVPMEVFLLKN
ncbi:hypothetical protein HK104_006432, partial [Borealophlyctis nickersoniae]